MIITPPELIEAIESKFNLKKFTTLELVGENKTFGHILVDDQFKLNIFISNEDEIMEIMETALLLQPNWN